MLDFSHPKLVFMKNSSADIVSKSQRVRANAVWLMNAASLAVAIGAVSKGVNSFVPQAQATAYVWDGGGSSGNLTTAANWVGDVVAVAASKGTATLDTHLFGTAGTSRMSITMTAGNRIFGTVTFDTLSNTYSSGWSISDDNTTAHLMITGDSSNTPTKPSFNNNYTVGNVTFSTIVSNVTANNTWTGVAGSNTIFQKAVYVTDSPAARNLTLSGAGNFTFNAGVKNSWVSTNSQTLTTSSAFTINSTGTTSITGAMDMRGQVNINTQGGTVELNGDNSAVGANLTRVAGTDTTYAFRLVQGKVLLGNNLALGTQDQVLGRSGSATSSLFELGVYTNAAISVANNFTLGASTGSNSVAGGYTLGGNAAVTSTYSGTVFLNKDARFNQVSGGTLNFTNSGAGITQASSSRNLTLDGEGNINISAGIGSGIIPIVGSATTSSTRVVTLAGTNSFTTGVTINSGVLQLGSSAALNSTVGSENTITWGASTSNGTLRLNGNSVVVKSLATNATPGTPIIENASGSNTSAVLTIGNSSNLDTTFAGVIRDGSGSGTLGINKAGTGALTLSGTNTYTGATNISAGSLNLTGSLAAGSTVSIGGSGTLRGTGTASGAVNISGAINPGSAGVGTLTIGDTDLQSGGSLNVQFFSGSGAAGSTGWDLLSTGVLSSSATSGSKFNINLISITTLGADTTGNASVFDNSTDQSFEIIRSSSSLASFDLTKLNLSAVAFSNGLGGGSWSLSNSGNSIYASFTKFVAGTIYYWSEGSWADTASGTGGAGSWDDASGSWDNTGGKTAVFATTGGTVTAGTVTAKKGITFSATGYTLTGGTITLADTAGLNTVTVDTDTAEIASALTGSGGFTKAGSGTLILSGNNSGLSGGMTIGLGTVKLGSANALGASESNVTITSGAILDLNGTNYTNTNALSVAGTGVITNSSATAGAYAGNVTLSAAASYVSTSGAISMSGTTNLNGFGLTLTTGTGDITLSNNLSGTGGLTINPAGAGNVTISGGINNAGSVVITPVTGGGNTTLSGNIGSNVTGLTYGTNNTTGTATTLLLNGTNTYTGTVTINAGTVKLGSSTAFGNSANSVVASTYASGVAIDLNGQTTSNPISIYGTGVSTTGVIINSSASAATVSGAITINGVTATIGATAGDITFSGAIKTASATNRTITLIGNVSTATNIYVNSGVLGGASSPGFLQLVVGSGGADKVKVSLLGTQILQTNGNVKITGGTLSLASSSTLSSSGMSLNAGGSTSDNSTLLLTAGNNYTWSSLAASGNLNFDTTDVASPTTITFTAGGNATTNNNFGQTGSASKQLNAREGVTVVIGSSSSTFFDLVGAAGTSNKLMKLDGAGTFTINSVLRENQIGGITVKGGINKVGAGTLNLNAANTYTGGTELRAGTTKLGNAAALGDSTSTVRVDTGATLDLNGQTIVNTNALNLNSGTITNTSATKATYAGLINVGGNGATITADAGDIDITNVGTMGLTTGTGYNLTFNGANGGTVSSIIGIGTGALNKSGAGTWTLSGANGTYTGTTNISNGTLALGASNAIGTGAVTITNAATLAIGANSDSVGTVTLTSGDITGSGGVLTSTGDFNVSAGTISAILAGSSSSTDLTKTGAGTVVLSGVNTYTGATTISGGILSVSSIGNGGVAGNLGAATNNSSNIVINGGTLKYTGAGETTDRKIKSGTAVTVDASGSGALVFDADPYSTITKLGSFVTVDTNTVYTLTGTNTADNTWDSRLVDNGTGVISLVKDGVGTWVLGGDISNSTSVPNPFTGGTTISGGKLKATTSTIKGAITNNSVFEFTNGSALNASYDGVISGTGSLNKSGGGAVTLTADNTYTGATHINSGSLVLGSNTGKISGSSAINVYNAATLKSTNTTDTTTQASAIVLKSGGILDLTEGNLKATSLTVDTLTDAQITKINIGLINDISNSLSLTTLTLTGNIAIDLIGTPTVAGTYDVLSWTSKSGSGTFNLLTQDTAEWAYTTNLDEDAKKYSITIASAFNNGGNYSTGTIVIPSGSTLGNVSGTATVSAAATTTVGEISGGTVTLNGADNTVGAISGGTVTLAAAGSTVASLATGGTLNVDANSVITSLTGGTLDLGTGVDADVKGGTSTATITGAGNLVKSGSDKLTLSGTSSDYSGETKVKAGELEVTNVAALGATSGITLGTASNSTAATFTYSGGAAEITTNITALSTSNAGNIVANSGSGLLTLAGNLTKDGTVLTLSGGTDGIRVTGEIIGNSANSDLVISTGTVTVESANSYTGPTFINSGATLIALNDLATGNGVVNVGDVNGGGTLQVGNSSAHAITLTTNGLRLYDGSTIRIFVDQVDITGLSAYTRDGHTHYDLTGTAGTDYGTILSGALNVTGVTAGGITIEVYGTTYNTPGLLTRPFYDFKFLEFTTENLDGLGNGLNISDLFTIDTTNLRYQTGDSYVRAGYNNTYLDDLIKMYAVQNGNNTVLMMSIPEPSTYGLGLGALALAAVAIRRRKLKMQKKETV